MSSSKFTKGDYFLYDIGFGSEVCIITRIENNRVYYKRLTKKYNELFDDWIHPLSTTAKNLEIISDDDAMVELL